MFRQKKEIMRSGSFARQRVNELLLSERLNCSLQTITAIKHELIRVIRKYISIEDTDASLWVTKDPPALMIRIPLRKKEKDAETI